MQWNKQKFASGNSWLVLSVDWPLHLKAARVPLLKAAGSTVCFLVDVLASSQQDLQHALHWFSAACDRDGIKAPKSTKKTKELWLSRKTSQCMLQVSGNTLQQVEKFMYFGVVYTSCGRWHKEMDTRIGKANAWSSSLCGHKPWVSNAAKLSVLKPIFVPIITNAMNLGLWPKEYDLNCKRQRWNFCDESTVWHLVTKCAAVKFVNPWMSNHFSESRDASCVGSAMCPEYPKENLAKQALLAKFGHVSRISQGKLGEASPAG